MNVGFNVIQPGLLSLVQDSGRFGLHGIGLTTGGPLDRNAFRWANRLCENPENSALPSPCRPPSPSRLTVLTLLNTGSI